MRRFVLIGLGVLELAVAIVLVLFSQQLPDRERVSQRFTHFGNVTRGAENQIASLQGQFSDLKRPEMQLAAQRLGEQTRKITEVLKKSHLDFNSLTAMNQGLADVAKGLDSWSQTLNPEQIQKLSEGFGTAAKFLDDNLAESAMTAANGIEEAINALKTDALKLSAMLQKAPPDLQAVRDIHDSLAKFDAGLEKVNTVLKLERFDAIKEGLNGMETALSTTAGQVEKLSNFTYPVITINGIKPNVEQRPFWPQGDTIAEGLRKAVKGMNAAGQELDGLHKELPTLRVALDDSRKVIARTREAMSKALSQQSEIEQLLRDVPKQSALLAERLPKLGEAFVKMLRETKRLKEVAVALRQTQQGLTNAAAQWPKLKDALAKSANVLRVTQGQFDKLLQNREQYETAMNGATDFASQFAEMLPIVNERLDARLTQQEQTLGQLKDGLAEVNAGLPDIERGTSDVLTMARWLMWMVAALVGLHGVYVCVDAWKIGLRTSVSETV